MDEKKGLVDTFFTAAGTVAIALAGCVAVHGISGFFAATAILPFDTVTAGSDVLKDVMVQAIT